MDKVQRKLNNWTFRQSPADNLLAFSGSQHLCVSVNDVRRVVEWCLHTFCVFFKVGTALLHVTIDSLRQIHG